MVIKLVWWLQNSVKQNKCVKHLNPDPSSQLKDGSSNSFLPLLIQRHRGVTLLAVGASSCICLFQLRIKPMYCKSKTLSLLCDITFNARPMFFLERSLFWYRLIGAIRPRGITGLRIKGEMCFHKMRKSPVPIYEGFWNALETADFPNQGRSFRISQEEENVL